MKFYRLAHTSRHAFARAGRRGTWYPNPGKGLCPECGRSKQERVKPLIVEWEPGSDLIADFTWPGLLDDLMVTERVRQCFEKCRFKGFEFGPVEMVQDVV